MTRRVPEEELHAPLRASAESNGGTPVWSAVSRATGVDRDRLRKVWTKMQAPPEAAPPVAVPHIEQAQPADSDEVRQLRSSLNLANAGIGIMIKAKQVSQLAPLLRYRDELAAQIRQACEAMAAREEPTEAEVIEGVERAATNMPAEHAEIMIEIFRSRNLL